MDDQFQVVLQMGMHKERLNLNPNNLVESYQMMREYAKQLVDRQYPTQKCPLEKILLFKHDYNSSNLLQILQNAEGITSGTVVEIVLSSKPEKPTHPHALAVISFISPTFCDYCGEMLIGLVKQGVRCSYCNLNFHKRCAQSVHNRCTGEFGDGVEPAAALGSGLPHTFVVHTYKKPTVCKVCNNLLFGLVKQGLQCRDCKVNTHKKCALSLNIDCRPVDQTSELSYCMGGVDIMDVDHSIEGSSSQIAISCGVNQMGLEEKLSTGDMIQLSRIPGQASVRTSKPKPTSAIMEGWLLHFTRNNMTRRRHYWVMDSTCITLYHNSDFQTATRFYKQIELASILGIQPYDGAPYDANTPPHCFEIVTKDLIYYVGENLEWYNHHNQQNKKSSTNGSGSVAGLVIPRRESGLGKASAQRWLDAIRSALLPPSRLAFDLNCGRSSQTPEGMEELKLAQQVALEFSQLYQIFEHEELGCGQFGVVYGGVHRGSGRKIAVKVISKTRFGRKQKDQLRTEVAILQNISYAGIITLEAMFETKDRIFVVMEKMEADMLEMILSDRAGRLTERVTKFLIFQIVKALKYLHSQDIAHCDLKPENVLLNLAESDFPQSKLCDFGYARIIGENTFRKTVVGTPAYLAPEVLEKKGYNKSLDMWSVGVIIYVTLSGTFPFNEGEEISNQITNASFMYPANPWSGMSKNSIDVINKLLRVNQGCICENFNGCIDRFKIDGVYNLSFIKYSVDDESCAQMDERLTVDECLAHPWLQDPQLFKDIRLLEEKIGIKYLLGEDEEYRLVNGESTSR